MKDFKFRLRCLCLFKEQFARKGTQKKIVHQIFVADYTIIVKFLPFGTFLAIPSGESKVFFAGHLSFGGRRFVTLTGKMQDTVNENAS